MAPPPNSGDATRKHDNDDDPLGGIDPMAWLESLAARQGAKPEELVTAANIDIPLPPADTVIDEPGYTPGYEVSKPTPAKAQAPRPEPAAVPPPAPPPAPVPEPAASVTSTDDLLGGIDPMAWLESLAARQGAKPEELVTAANIDVPMPPADSVIDEPGYTPGYDTGRSASPDADVRPGAGRGYTPAKAEAPRPEPAAVPPPAPPPAPVPEPAASVTSTDDLLGGIDPMAWLESLAARQGAKPEELVTAANIDIPLPPADTVIDEPGYVDYDPFGSGTPSREPARTPEPTAPPPLPEPVVPGVGTEDLLSGMDPLAWLESLGAKPEAEATELSDSTVKLPTGSKVDSSFTEEAETVPGMSVEEAAALLSVGTPEEAPSADDILGGMDPLAWLESLAARQGANPEELVTGGKLELPTSPTTDELAEYSPFAANTESTDSSMGPESTLSWLEELAREQTQPLNVVSVEPVAEAPARDAGGTSTDINEVQAWLDEQAQALELTRVQLEAEEAASDEERPAEAGEIPSWLLESLGEAPVPAPAAPVLSEDIAMPVAPEDLPAWLTQPEAESGVDIDFDLIASLTGSLPPVIETIPEEPKMATGELEAMIRPASPDEVDSWAEALDEEYERRRAGDETVPDWYREAMSRAEAELQARAAAQPKEQAEELFPKPETAGEFAMPDWLGGVTTEEPVEALPGEIPDWLRMVAPEPEASVPTPAAPVPEVPVEELPESATPPNWLTEQVESIEPAELPDWLRPAVMPEPEPKPEPEPEPELSAPPVSPEPVEPGAPPVEMAPVETVPVEAVPVEPVPVETVPVPEPEPIATVPVRPVPPVRPPEPFYKAPEPAPAAVRSAQPVPAQHHERLKQARVLVANNQHLDSLGHYQSLIDDAQLLEETRGDLRDMVDQHPNDPRLRRMLGDTHMRLGDLQAALDTYRSALDQL